MSKTTVFVGPSARRADVLALSEKTAFDIRPPAGMGDIRDAVQNRTERIVLIDGEFENRQPPWHREILDAIDSGVEVVGCGSMGALRAAELFDFGMAAFGVVAHRYVTGRKLLLNLVHDLGQTSEDIWFEMCRQKALNDDDDVSLIYGPSDASYAQYTIPMVNIILNFEQADLNPSVSRDCMVALKRVNFRDRTSKRVKTELQDVFENRKIDDRSRGIIAEVFQNFVDYKSRDAQQLMNQLANQNLFVHRCNEIRNWKKTYRWFDDIHQS